ncbi:MAG: right-handed parallel beta-helix repeat-containing protein [Candidatus Thorarchaeota archaeon]
MENVKPIIAYFLDLGEFELGEERAHLAHRDRVSRCFLSATLFMLLLALIANMTPFTDLDRISHQSTTVVSEPERRGMLLAGTPHGPIAIDGDANFADTALLEGWPGDGSPGNPYIIDGLDIDLDGGYGSCIGISNTRVFFTIRNCKLTGAVFGMLLENVINGELVNNTCSSNDWGIWLEESDSNTVASNNCTSNRRGIYLYSSDSNIVTENTCNNNEAGIRLYGSIHNTVTENTCNSNVRGESDWTGNGIYLDYSDDNTVISNTCSSNTECGISLYESDSNTVANNTCNNNEVGIALVSGDYNTVANNTCLGNTEHDIYLHDSDTTTEDAIPGVPNPAVLLLIGLVAITILGIGLSEVLMSDYPLS